MLTSVVVIIVSVLAIQCYPVALGFTLKKDPAKVFGFIGILTIIHSLMLYLGFLLGSTFMHLMDGFKTIVMFLGFTLVGVRLFFDVLSIRKGERTFAITSPSQLILVGVAMGINPFLTGLLLNYMEVNIHQLISLMALVTFIVSFIGSLTNLRKVNLYLATLFATLGGIVMVFAAIYFTFFYF